MIGIFSLDGRNVVPMFVTGLQSLQHRGQEAWKMAVCGHPSFKRMGIVSQSVEKEAQKIERLGGKAGIGHVRYSTTAVSTLENAHPLDIGSPSGDLSFHIAHNGTLEREPILGKLHEGLSIAKNRS